MVEGGGVREYWERKEGRKKMGEGRGGRGGGGGGGGGGGEETRIGWRGAEKCVNYIQQYYWYTTVDIHIPLWKAQGPGVLGTALILGVW